MSKPLLSLRNLTKIFEAKGGAGLRAVDGISLDVQLGQTLGIVGETGSGKSTLGRLMLRLIEPTSGEVTFNGVDLRAVKVKELRQYRRQMQMIFQDPLASLDPRMSVGNLIMEPLIIHQIGTKTEQIQMAQNILAKVGLSPDAFDRFPHEFSGGQRQRISIARAIITQPQLIVADEPVSALDVSIQSQILNLMLDLRREFNLTYIFISHDLAVVQHIADVVAVMYLGKIVEMAPALEIFTNPKHPYTKALISAIPQIDAAHRTDRVVLIGDIPSPRNPPTGCHFHPRCPSVMAICSTNAPHLIDLKPASEGSSAHTVSCHLYPEGAER